MTVNWANGLLWRRGAEAWQPGNDPTPPLEIEVAQAVVQPTGNLLDSFNTGALQNVDARSGWGTGRVVAGDVTMTTDATPTAATSGSPSASNMWGTQFVADQEAQFLMGTPDTVILVVRGNSASANGQTAGYKGVVSWDGNHQIWKIDNSVLIAGTFEHPVAGDSFTVQAIGTMLTLWRRRANEVVWDLLLVVNDSTYAGAGYVGMLSQSGSTPLVDAFGGGPIQTLTDIATNAITISQTASETVTGGSVSDSGTQTFVLAPASSQTISDAGTVTLSITPSAAEQMAGLGTAIIGLNPFDATPVVDDFNRGANQNLTARAGWGSGAYNASEPTLATNGIPDAAVVSAINVWRSNYWATSYSDQESWATVGSIVGAHNLDLIVRAAAVNTNNPTGYAAEINLATGDWNLWRYAPGATFLANNSVSHPHTAGTSWKLRIVGNTITMWRRPPGGEWVQDASSPAAIIDSTYASGFPAIEVDFSDAATKIDEYGAGGLPTAPVETVTDAGVCTIVVTQSASESITGGTLSDAGTVTLVVAETAIEAPTDSGTQTLLVLPAASETWPSVGADTLVLAPTATETLSDAGANTLVVAATGIESSSDAGTVTMALSQTASEAPTDSGSQTIVVSQTDTDQPLEAGLCTISLTQSATEQIQQPTADTLSVSQAAVESVTDVATQTIVLVPSGLEGTGGDSGTCSLAVANTGSEQISEAGTVTMVVPETAVETESATAAVTIAIVSTASDVPADAGACTLVLAFSATELISSQSDSGTVTLVLAPSATEAVADGPTCSLSIVAATGGGALGTPVLDDFNTGANQNVSARAGWGSANYWGEPTHITDAVPTSLIVAGVGWHANYWNTILTDQEVWAKVGLAGSLQYWMLSTRSSVGPNASEYELSVDPLGNWSLDTWVAGGFAGNVGSGILPSWAAGNAVKLRSIGSTHTVWFKAGGSWVLQATLTDATLASGYITIQGRNNGGAAGSIDEFGGGVPVAVPTETIIDPGTATVVIIPVAGTLSDSGTVTLVIAASASELVITPGISDAGTERVLIAYGELYPGALLYPDDVVTPGYVHGYEAIIESSTCTIHLLAREFSPEDDGFATIVVSNTGTSTLGDAGSVAFATDRTGYVPGDIVNPGDIVYPVNSFSVETIRDSGSCVFSVSQTAAGLAIFTGLCTLSVASTAAETITSAPNAAILSMSNTGDETIVGAPVTQIAVISQTYFGGAPGALGNLTFSLSPTAVETLTNDFAIASVTITIEPSHVWTSGFDPHTPTPLQGGDSAERRRQRVAALRAKANASTNPQHHDRKLARR